MGKIQAPKRIRAEDYSDEDKEMAQQLAAIYNNFVEDVYNTLNGNIDYGNLNRSVIDVVVRLDGSGNLSEPLQIRNPLRTFNGIICLDAENLQDTSIIPTAQPYLARSVNGQIITITKISGLQASSRYRLRIEIIG